MEDLMTRVIKFAQENEFDIYLPSSEHDDDEDINIIRIVNKDKEKAVYFEIE